MSDRPAAPPRADRHSASPTATNPSAEMRLGEGVVDIAGDVMTRDPDRVACTDSLREVARRMRNLLVAFLPVCDEHGDLRGIVALRDVHRVIGAGDPTRATASCLAQAPATTIGVEDSVGQARGLMVEQRLWLLPVLDGRRLVGVIRYASAPDPTTAALGGGNPHRRHHPRRSDGRGEPFVSGPVGTGAGRPRPTETGHAMS